MAFINQTFVLLQTQQSERQKSLNLTLLRRQFSIIGRQCRHVRPLFIEPGTLDRNGCESVGAVFGIFIVPRPIPRTWFGAFEQKQREDTVTPAKVCLRLRSLMCGASSGHQIAADISVPSHSCAMLASAASVPGMVPPDRHCAGCAPASVSALLLRHFVLRSPLSQ